MRNEYKYIMVIISCFVLLFPQMTFAAQKLSQVDFERGLTDPYSFVNFEYGQFVSYVQGHTGYAARSSHSGDDGSGSSDFCIATRSNYWPSSGELYVRYYLKYEAEYINTSGNVKLLWNLSEAAHNEIIYSADSTPGILNLRWQCGGGGSSWDGGTITKYGNTRYTKGQWMMVEIYFKLSSGATHMNADGVQWIKINGTTVISGSNVITGVPGVLKSPAINATANQATGHGWWQIDDFEIWDGIPDTRSSLDITPPSRPSGVTTTIIP